MQIGKWARAFCTMDARNGALKSRWVIGILSAIHPDGKVELTYTVPIPPDDMETVASPGPYICDSVMQLGDWVRAYCTMDAQNGQRKGAGVQGVLYAFRPDYTVEVMSPITPIGPYICNQVWPCPDMPGPPAFIKEWRKRLGVL